MNKEYFQDCILKIAEKQELDFQVTAKELAYAKQITNPLRKQSFLIGRHYAHLLLKKYNQPLQTLATHKNGAIIWGNKIKGSISHSQKKIALCTSQSEKILSIGLDLERIDRNPSLAVYQKIKHPNEKFSNLTNIKVLKIFCAKEAVIKCFGQLAQKIRFQEICILGLDPCSFSLLSHNITSQKIYLAPKDGQLLAAFILKK